MKILIAAVIALTLSACTSNYFLVEKDTLTDTPRFILVKNNNQVIYLRALTTSEDELIHKGLPTDVREDLNTKNNNN